MSPSRDLGSLLQSVRNRSKDFDGRSPMMVSLLDAGETYIAFEDTCSNLYEFGVELTEREFALIQSIAASFDVPEQSWSLVTAGVPAGWRVASGPHLPAHTVDHRSVRDVRGVHPRP